MPTKPTEELIVNLLFEPSRISEKLISQVYEGIVPSSEKLISARIDRGQTIHSSQIQEKIKEK